MSINKKSESLSCIGNQYFSYNGKQVFLHEAVKLEGKDDKGNWILGESIGPRITYAPNFIGLCKDALENDQKYVYLFDLNDGEVSSINSGKRNIVGVIRYAYFHSDEFSKKLTESGYEKVSSERAKTQIMQQVMFDIEKEIITKLVDQHENKNGKQRTRTFKSYEPSIENK